jgi:hypothetical protein
VTASTFARTLHGRVPLHSRAPLHCRYPTPALDLRFSPGIRRHTPPLKTLTSHQTDFNPTGRKPSKQSTPAESPPRSRPFTATGLSLLQSVRKCGVRGDASTGTEIENIPNYRSQMQNILHSTVLNTKSYALGCPDLRFL